MQTQNKLSQYILDVPRPEGWPEDVVTVEYPCSADHTLQKAVYYDPGTENAPLAVVLHTWSYGYEQPNRFYAELCRKYGWIMIHPHFRGPNWTPDALGSEKMVQDLCDAVAFAQSVSSVDTDRVYLTGGSGGGHASLLLAGRHPELWAGVSSWVPISDAAAWYYQSNALNTEYGDHIVQACGGIPAAGSAAGEEARKRSPLTWLDNASSVPVDISAGIHDGHNGYSVPVSQSLNAFNVLARPEDRISGEDIRFITENGQIPASLRDPSLKDPLYGKKVPLFRRISGNVRITVFEGVHEILPDAAFAFLAHQRKGVPAVWDFDGEASYKHTDGEALAR